MDLFIYTFAALFSVINPLGTVPVFVGLTVNDTEKQRNRTALLASVNTCVILLISFFAGKYVLSFFGITLDALRIAGGMIITTSGFALLTGSFSRHKGMDKERVKADLLQREEVSLTPLAIPMLAGPGSISLLIAMNQQYAEPVQMVLLVAGILSVCVASWIVLRGSHYIVKLMGASGINAVSRIIGFIVIAIGVQYIITAAFSLTESWLAGR